MDQKHSTVVGLKSSWVKLVEMIMGIGMFLEESVEVKKFDDYFWMIVCMEGADPLYTWSHLLQGRKSLRGGVK